MRYHHTLVRRWRESHQWHHSVTAETLLINISGINTLNIRNTPLSLFMADSFFCNVMLFLDFPLRNYYPHCSWKKQRGTSKFFLYPSTIVIRMAKRMADIPPTFTPRASTYRVWYLSSIAVVRILSSGFFIQITGLGVFIVRIVRIFIHCH